VACLLQLRLCFSSKMALLLVSVEKYAGISTHVFQIGVQAERVLFHGHVDSEFNSTILFLVDIY
jgi:hypothetical protein